MRRAVIFVNGEFTPPPVLKQIISPDAYIIAVDGGTRHAFRIGVVPHIIIGDLDSLSPDDLARAEAAHVALLRFSAQKDETDLELALQHARERGITNIFLLGASGGRFDHALANLFLLSHSAFSNLNIRIITGNQITFLIRDTAHIAGNPGDFVSILPIGGDAVGVSNEGLEWPLHDATLPCGSPRGISNVLSGERAVIHIRRGMLVCTVTHRTQNC